LNALAPLTAPGGYLLYSTCSIENLEDEEQIRTFLKEHGEYTLIRQRKLFPDNEYDGAFGALLQKER
jgi:16S rRNA (cytosine967-C5)-methyltransferase